MDDLQAIPHTEGFRSMYIVAIAWLYVALMMAVAEATASNGTVLGAVLTFLLYGLGPVALVMYLLRTPGRRTARRQAELAADAAQADNDLQPTPSTTQPDGGGLAPGDAIAPVRKEP